jgi:VanZ family protein
VADVSVSYLGSPFTVYRSPFLSLWGPVIVYMAILFGLSSMSTPPPPPADFTFYDVHILAYAGLGALTARATGRGLRDVSMRAVLGAIVISSLYGVSDEYHQLFVPGRSFDVLDMVADAIGSVAGASAVGAWGRIRRLVGW